MASGYITSDGKDLDQRYLGIDAKAKSAETADVATTATQLSTVLRVVACGDPINISLKNGATYTINEYGWLGTNGHDTSGDGAVTINGVNVAKVGLYMGYVDLTFVKPGDVIKHYLSGSTVCGFIPVAVQ